MVKSWQTLKVSSDRTHHIDKSAAYPSRFHSVLKFHEPGLAAASNSTGAFHIDPLGNPAYSKRFLQTFGFYEGRAAVQDASGWFHILPSSSPLYSTLFSWVGNFQENYCTVRDFNGSFFHIDLNGMRPYSQTFCYAGDFHDGFAVVQNEQGLHNHIDSLGNILHKNGWIDLDVYHKGFARAKDQNGWFHIDLSGLPAYPKRYKNVEPFYNGIARVETELGKLLRITERGEEIEVLRNEIEDPFHQVSAELVSYWRFYTLQSANELHLFDNLLNSTDKLSELLILPKASTIKLLRGLQEMGFVKENGDFWEPTKKGEFFESKHPFTLQYACRLWGEEHLTSWSQLTYSLKSGLPAFNHLYDKGWFDWLKENPEKEALYHKALSIYAKRDYDSFTSSIDLKNHHSIADIGGSTGALLINILNKNPHLQGTLLDLPSVIELATIPLELKERIRCLPIHFFEAPPSITVESAVLSRILHDWPDAQAVTILTHVRSLFSSNPKNRLYIIEKIQQKNSPHGALLDLNMLVMTGGVERTLEEFSSLLKQGGFILEDVKALNEVSSTLVARVV